VVYLI